mmetsp:Transcript_89075/g.252548  ORF Transcript_89075/g.252548 Transcript_89075/m.252548 type:complete len:266 (-) Transcript_89075:269-1066(-)
MPGRGLRPDAPRRHPQEHRGRRGLRRPRAPGQDCGAGAGARGSLRELRPRELRIGEPPERRGEVRKVQDDLLPELRSLRPAPLAHELRGLPPRASRRGHEHAAPHRVHVETLPAVRLPGLAFPRPRLPPHCAGPRLPQLRHTLVLRVRAAQRRGEPGMPVARLHLLQNRRHPGQPGGGALPARPALRLSGLQPLSARPALRPVLRQLHRVLRHRAAGTRYAGGRAPGPGRRRRCVIGVAAAGEHRRDAAAGSGSSVSCTRALDRW